MVLIGRGMTGMYLIDFSNDYCDSNDDCLTDQVCCNFYGEDSGVCDTESNCQAITQITKEEKERISTDVQLQEMYKLTEEEKLNAIKTISSHLEKPQAENNYPTIISGIVLLALGIIWLIYLRKG
ncbi:MAG: hypothetical protein KKA79_01110 [Nanoarchaeota archaeon]|nr:hypothetical protein [Nanoarchaeota archaeon]